MEIMRLPICEHFSSIKSWTSSMIKQWFQPWYIINIFFWRFSPRDTFNSFSVTFRLPNFSNLCQTTWAWNFWQIHWNIIKLVRTVCWQLPILTITDMKKFWKALNCAFVLPVPMSGSGNELWDQVCYIKNVIICPFIIILYTSPLHTLHVTP